MDSIHETRVLYWVEGDGSLDVIVSVQLGCGHDTLVISPEENGSLRVGEGRKDIRVQGEGGRGEFRRKRQRKGRCWMEEGEELGRGVGWRKGRCWMEEGEVLGGGRGGRVEEEEVLDGGRGGVGWRKGRTGGGRRSVGKERK